jgi:hypothetical protein
MRPYLKYDHKLLDRYLFAIKKPILVVGGVDNIAVGVFTQKIYRG